MRRIKSGGISGLPTGILEDMTELVSSLAKAGVFVVPKGELEGWLSHLNISASKRNKWAWANEAAASVRKLGPQPGDVWDFIREVAQHLSIQLT
jgi:hypothetical protein